MFLIACAGSADGPAPVSASAPVSAPASAPAPVSASAPVSAPASAPASASASASVPASAPAPAASALEAELARIAATSGGTMGVAVIHLETGEQVAFNGALRFPMQSVYKFPIGVQLLKRVEEGSVDLDRKVLIRREDLRWGASTIADRHPKGGVELTVRELLRLMVGESDNTASDLLLAMAGGPEAVTQMAASHGLGSILVSRPEGQLLLDFHGVEDSPARRERTATKSLLRAVPPNTRTEALKRYLADPRDTATPVNMARLLVLLKRGELLKPQSTALLMQIMTDTQTGPKRLRAGLPAGTPLAHKTGTSASHEGKTAVVNDVGLITLPDGRGHAAVAVFVKEANKGTEAAEAAIASAARAAYERWTKERARGAPSMRTDLR